MTNIAQKIAVITSSLALGLVTLAANPAQAALFDFRVDIDSGDLNGESYSGSFEFDDSNLTGSGDEFLGVSKFDFNFLGSSFTEADNPEVAFLDGEFLGLSFSGNSNGTEFAFNPGFFDTSDASFFYEPTNGIGGAGDVTYTPVPEPTTMLGTGLAVGLGLLLKKKKNAA